MYYNQKSEFIKSLKDRKILSYAWGGVESGENMQEYEKVVSDALQAGYDTLMTSYGITMLADSSFNKEHVRNTMASMEYAIKAGFKLIPRFYVSITPDLLDCDRWSTKEKCCQHPDPFSDNDIAVTKVYYENLLPLFEDITDILAFCPTFGFLGQSLFDGGNFDSPPAQRSCGYSDIAKGKFNKAYGYAEELPIPVSDGSIQDFKTVQWFGFRQRCMTAFALEILESCKKVTQKPVGMFSEYYASTFTHLSEASITGQADFLIQDCTFGCETYDMPNTLAETHGDAQNYDTFEEYKNVITPRLINAAKKGNKLMGFWWRSRPDYSMKLLPVLAEIENKYRTYEFKSLKNIAVLSTSNHSATALPTQSGQPFAIDNSYPVGSNYPMSFIEKDMNEKAEWHMIAETEFCRKELSFFDLVIISDKLYFKADEWDTILKHAKEGVRFLLTGHLPIMFDRENELSDLLRYNLKHDTGFKGIVENADPSSLFNDTSGTILPEVSGNQFQVFSQGLNYEGTFMNSHSDTVTAKGTRNILMLSDRQLFCELRPGIFCVPNSLFRAAGCFGGDFKTIADKILEYLIIHKGLQNITTRR